MNKIKMIVSAIAIVAVVGGALAFKAKGPVTYCYNNPGSQFCPNTGHFFDPGAVNFATAIPPVGGCAANTLCTANKMLSVE